MLCYIAFCAVVSFILGLSLRPVPAMAVGAATLAGYNVAKYIHIWKLDFAYAQAIRIMTYTATVITGIAMLCLGWRVAILFLVCSILTSLYSLPQLLGRSFRQVPLLKLLTIGITWTLLAVGLPLLLNNDEFHKDIYLIKPLVLLAVRLTLFVIALCIPFEIRDLKYDQKQLGTLPQLIGVRGAKMVAYLLLIVCSIICFMTDYEQMYVELAIYAVTVLLVLGSTPHRSDYYSSLIVESVPVLWLLLLFIFA
jgi:hypothetical protein